MLCYELLDFSEFCNLISKISTESLLLISLFQNLTFVELHPEPQICYCASEEQASSPCPKVAHAFGGPLKSKDTPTN